MALALDVLRGKAQGNPHMLLSYSIVVTHFLTGKALREHIEYQVDRDTRLHHWLPAVNVGIRIHVGKAQGMLHFVSSCLPANLTAAIYTAAFHIHSIPSRSVTPGAGCGIPCSH